MKLSPFSPRRHDVSRPATAIVVVLLSACIGLTVLTPSTAAADSAATDHRLRRSFRFWKKPLVLPAVLPESSKNKQWYNRCGGVLQSRAVWWGGEGGSQVKDHRNAAAATTTTPSTNQKGFFSRFQRQEKNDSSSSSSNKKKNVDNNKKDTLPRRKRRETENKQQASSATTTVTKQPRWRLSNRSTKEESDTKKESSSSSDTTRSKDDSKHWLFRRSKSETKNAESESSSTTTSQDDALKKKLSGILKEEEEEEQSDSKTKKESKSEVAVPPVATASTTTTDETSPKTEDALTSDDTKEEQMTTSEADKMKQEAYASEKKEDAEKPKLGPESSSVEESPVKADDASKDAAKKGDEVNEEKEDIEPKKSTKGRLWQRKEKEPEKSKESEKESDSSTKKEGTPASTNATVSETPQTNQTVASSQPSGIIIAAGMPPGGPAFRGYYRRGHPGIGPPVSQHGPSPNSVVLVEMFASLIATVGRLWFLTWLTRRLASAEESMHVTQHYVWERLNDRYGRDSAALQTALKSPPAGVSKARWRRGHVHKVQKRLRKRHVDLSKVFTRTVVVIELSDDPKEGINFSHFAEVITFLLHEHNNRAFGVHKETGEPMELEVVIMVQSPGGSVATYGLAAAQMERLSKAAGITTTVCVDKYAASGGYMIASQAHKLIAAPFSTLGSIGVIMEGLNFNELAQRYGIQPVVLKAGTNKNTLSTFGSISRRDIRHEEERLAKVHEAFQQLVVRGRPCLADNISSIADGSVYLGMEALDLQLVDAVMTSNEYLLDRIFSGDRVLKLHRSYQARYSLGRMSISPLEILPHLKSWISKIKEHPEQYTAAISRMVQFGSFLGFAKHLFDVYVSMNRDRR